MRRFPPVAAVLPPRSAWVLAALVFATLAMNSARPLFTTHFWEFSDWAANGLAIDHAKHGLELYGNYSRWGFNHPGPIFFFVYALSETLLHDGLRLVPQPANAHVLAGLALMAFFFAAAVAVFARRLPPSWRPLFLPLALILAVWHFGSVGPTTFLSIWPPHVLMLPFLCLLVTAASVASGGGSDLPLMVLSACFLAHGHVAQPLFIVPLSLLAYAGLVWNCRRERGRPAVYPWRTFRLQHAVALGLIVLFLVPIALDAIKGADSNLHLILTHLRLHHGEHKPLTRALCYFLHFGAYSHYQPGREDFGRYGAAGMLAFLHLHWRAYSLWTLALLAPAGLFPLARRSFRPAVPVDGGRSEPTAGPPGFLAAFYAVAGTALGLTLVWGMKQDGEMFYFNAFFNHALYYAALLPLAAALAGSLLGALRVPRPVLLGGLYVAVVAVFLLRAERFYVGPGEATEPAVVTNVRAAVAAELPSAPARLLVFEHAEWPIAAAVAIQLERLRQPFYVEESWRYLFGRRHSIDHFTGSGPAPRPWRVVPQGAGNRGDPALPTRALLPGHELMLGEMTLNPAGGAVVFRANGNWPDYALLGWSPPTADWTWSVSRTALLVFRPEPAARDVQMTLEAWPFRENGKVVSERVEIALNGTAVGSFVLRDEQHPLTVRIPAALWNQAVATAAAGGEPARLQLTFPEAKSPAERGSGLDSRRFGAGFRAILFRLADGPPTS